ncbi:DUF559 domain-containing protein [Rhodococcoides trifolii]|nr:DUF559 domain-containing protein [Rhodococcus trifolii]
MTVRGSSDPGMTRHALRSGYRRLHPGVWVKRDEELTASVRAQAAWKWAPAGAILAGYSAAAIHGAKYLPSTAKAELIVTERLRPPTGVTVRRRTVSPVDVHVISGMRVTSPVRTAFDLCRDLDESRAVEAVDALYQATTLTRATLLDYCHNASRVHGYRGVRGVVELTNEGAESIWETRTRLFMVRSGLPCPDTQLVIYDGLGNWIGRFDLGYKMWKVVVEYDGDQHFEYEQRQRDVERWNALSGAGWRLIRVKARQLTQQPELLLGHIRRALRDAGASI